MSNINGIGGSQPVQRPTLDKQVHQDIQPKSTQPARAADRLELSGLGGILEQLKAGDTRDQKIAEIRQQIEEGTYETDDKLNATIDRLIDEVTD